MDYDKKELDEATAAELKSGKWTPKTPEDALGDTEIAERKAGKLGELAGDLITVCQLIKDVATGKYDASWASIAILAAAVAYVACPIDLLPDIILGIGFLDDAAVLGLALKTAKDIIDDYKVWKKNH